MSPATLSDVSRSFEAIFLAKAEPQMTLAERIIELSGAQWVGLQHGDDEPLVMFRDPVTGSTLALAESKLTVANAQARMLASRASFGVVA